MKSHSMFRNPLFYISVTALVLAILEVNKNMELNTTRSQGEPAQVVFNKDSEQTSFLGKIIFQQPLAQMPSGKIIGTIFMTDMKQSYGLNVYYSKPLPDAMLYRTKVDNNEFLCVSLDESVECATELPLQGLQQKNVKTEIAEQ